VLPGGDGVRVVLAAGLGLGEAADLELFEANVPRPAA
jgi:hypothetical protein